MNNKIFIPLFLTTFLLSGYSTIKVVQANPPLEIAQSIWKRFSSSEGGFNVLMPGAPSENNKSVKTNLGPIPVRMFYVIRDNEAVYMVAYSDFPGNISQNSSDINQVLAGVVSGFSQGARGRLLSQRNIRLNNFPGREIRLQIAEGVIARGRIYLVNKRLYQVVVATNKERYLTKSIDGFLNSFQLVKGSAALKTLSLSKSSR